MRLDETEPEGRVHYFKITSKPYLYTVERILDNIQYRKGVSLATMSDAIDIKRRIIRIRKDLGDIEDALKELSRGKKERAAAVLRDLSRPEKGIVRYTGSESVDEMRKLLNRAKRTLEMTKEQREAQLERINKIIGQKYKVPTIREITNLDTDLFLELVEKVFGQTYTPSKYENFWATLRRKERMQLKKLVENADGIVALQNMLEHLRHKKIREVALRIRNKEILANVLSRVPLKRRNDLAEALQRDPFETIKRINDAIAMVEEDMESTAKYVAQRAAAEEKLDEILRAIRT